MPRPRAGIGYEESKVIVQVHEVMTTDVVTLTTDTPVETAAARLTSLQVGSLPVVDNDQRLIGVLTASELDTADHTADRTAPPRTVADLMTTPTITTSPNATVNDLAAQMILKQVHSVPVVTDTRLVGVVTASNVIAAFRRDDDTSTEVRGRLAERGLLNGCDVSFSQGVITIHGSVDGAIGEMMSHVAETVPGVTEVRLQP